MDGRCSLSFGSLGDRAHEGDKRNCVIKAIISKLISNSSLGFDQTPVCAVGERGGAEQGHLPGSPLGSRALRGTECTGVCRSILLPFGVWGAFGWFGFGVCLK